MTIDRPIRIALFGITGFGKTHLEEIQRRESKGEVQLTAVVAINHASIPELVGSMRRGGVSVFESVEAYFAANRGGADLVVLPTSIESHETLTCQALQTGHNVLLEKPVTGSVESLERMIAVEQSSPGFCAVAFQHTFDAGVRAIKRRLVSGELGRIKDISLVGIWPRADAYYQRNAWAGKLRRNGVEIRDSPVNNAFSHFLNLALFWSAEEYWAIDRAASLKGRCFRARPIESFDTASLEIATESGSVVRVHLSHAGASPRDVEIRLRCEKGEIAWSPAKGPDHLIYLRQMYHTALAAARGEAAHLYSLEMGGEHVRLVERLHEQIPIEDFSGEVAIDPETGQRDIVGLRKWFEAAHERWALFNDWDRALGPVS